VIKQILNIPDISSISQRNLNINNDSS